MKKFLKSSALLILCFVLIFSLSACGKKGPASEKKTEDTADQQIAEQEKNAATSETENLYAFGAELVDGNGKSKSEYHMDQDGNVLDKSGKVIIESKHVKPFTCVESVKYDAAQFNVKLLGKQLEDSEEIAVQPQKFTFEFKASPENMINKIVEVEISDPAMVQIAEEDNQNYIVQERKATSAKKPAIQLAPTANADDVADENASSEPKTIKMKIDDTGVLKIRATVALTGTCEIRLRNIIDTEIDSFNITASAEAGTDEQLAEIERQNNAPSPENSNTATTPQNGTTPPSASPSPTPSSGVPAASDGHTHDFEKKVVEPTIRTQGYTLYTCKVCGYSYRSNYVPKTQHTHEYETTVIQPTYTSGGYTRHTCKICGNSYTDNETPQLSCTHTQTIDDVHQATCTEGGYTMKTCQMCKKTWKDNVVPALGHDMQPNPSLSVPATCEQDGKEVQKCTRCNETSEKTIEKLGHSYNEGTVTTEPTCTAAGVKTFTCSKCGGTKTESIPAKGHSQQTTETISKQPTCTEDGLKEIRCSACGEIVRTEPIAKLGHSTVNQGARPATCTEAGYTGDEVCTREGCGITVTAGTAIPATGHKYATQGQRAATCSTPGYTGDQVCSVCGDTIYGQEIPTIAHDFTRKDYKDSEQAHPYKDPTCTEAGYTGDEVCKVCGALGEKGESIPPLGHQEGNAIANSEGYFWYCTRCNALLRTAPPPAPTEPEPQQQQDPQESPRTVTMPSPAVTDAGTQNTEQQG